MITQTHPTETGGLVAVFDDAELGHRLRSARYLAGYATVHELNDALDKRFGVRFSQRSVYAVERGDQKPSAEMLFALAMLYDPPGGLAFFSRAVDERDRAAFENLCHPPR